MKHNAFLSDTSIVLIQPPASIQQKGESVLLTDFDSVGLLALRGYLESFHLNVKIFHMDRALKTGYTVESIMARFRKYMPFVFGVSMNWLHLSAGALETAALLKEYFPPVPVFIGGTHGSLFAEEIIRDYHHSIDGIVVGEGEECFLEIIRALSEQKSLEGIPGLMVIRENRIIYTPRSIKGSPDTLPFYSYKKLYPRPLTQEAFALGALNTTRGGCKKNCTFCLESCRYQNSHRKAPVAFSAERLCRQIDLFCREGRNFITIEDPISSHGDSLITELIEEMIKRKIHVKHLSLFVEPGSFSRDVFDLLEKAPVDELVLSFGIETGSPRISRNMGRPYDYGKLYRELEYVGKKHYSATSWWMIGLPGEREEDIHMTFSMIKETMKMGIFPQSLSPLILFPQTKLAQDHRKFSITLYMKTFEDFKQFSYARRNKTGIYPNLITHDSTVQPRELTLRYIKEMKAYIQSALSDIPVLDRKQDAIVSGYVRFRENEIF